MMKSLITKIALGAMVATLLIYFLMARGGGTVPPKATTKYEIFVDQTGSSTLKQREQWLLNAERLIESLRPGDKIVIRPMHDNTLGSGPLLDEGAPLPENSGYRARLIANQRIAVLKKKATEVLTAALNAKVPARYTDVLSAFDRVRPEGSECQTVVVFFSDMLNSERTNGLLNFEHSRLTAEQFPQLITALARQHNWHATTLARTKVQVILPSFSSGDAKALNDPLVLKNFYEQLVGALGGELVSFDHTFKGVAQVAHATP